MRQDKKVQNSSSARLMLESGLSTSVTEPHLTIAVCAYRHSDYIEECLRSINDSMVTSIELLVIDDGSPDDTFEKCLKFPYREGIAVRVYTKTNKGLVDSLRLGLSLARGTYFAAMASDDFYERGGLEAALSLLEKESRPIDALLCQARTVGLVDRMVYGLDMERLFEKNAFSRLEKVWTAPPSPMLLQATVFNTHFLRSLHPWEDSLELDDWPTFIRVFAAEAQLSANIKYASSVQLCRYRVHAQGIHAQLDRHLRVTEQVAATLVPPRYRRTCQGNVRIKIGLALLYEGCWRKGLATFFLGFKTNPSPIVIWHLFHRAARFFVSRLMGRKSNSRS